MGVVNGIRELVEGLKTGTKSNKGLRELVPLLDPEGST
jgi:hypothetical protein